MVAATVGSWAVMLRLLVVAKVVMAAPGVVRSDDDTVATVSEEVRPVVRDSAKGRAGAKSDPGVSRRHESAD